MAKKPQAISVQRLKATKFSEIPFKGAFRDLIGRPEANGSWMVKGPPGAGKTTFLLQLAKELTNYGGVVYNSLEEGVRKSFRDAIVDVDMDQVPKGSFKMLHRWQMPEFIEYMKSSRAKFAFIDSVQYTFMTVKEYKQMQEALSNKLLIFNSHINGKQADGTLAKKIEYDADVKLDVEGFRAYSRSRASRGTITKPYTIWEEGASKYYDLL